MFCHRKLFSLKTVRQRKIYIGSLPATENVTEIIKELHTNLVNEHYILMVIVDSVT